MANSMDFDYPEFYKHKSLVARKEHKCDECHGTIKTGEKYELHNGKCDDFFTFKICSDCHEMRANISNKMGRDECLPFGELLEHVEEDATNLKKLLATAERRGKKLHESWYKRLKELEEYDSTK